MATSAARGDLVAAALGALAALVLWLALAAPFAMGLLHPWPVPPPASDAAPPAAAARRDDARPTVTAAILLSAAGTEITDFLAPYAILAASGAFTVHAVAPARDVVPLNGGLGVIPELTFDELDALHPRGVDVVVLPNVLDPESAVLRDWVRGQAARGARVASICEGARLLAGTGLLDGRAATSHWAALGALRDAHPEVRWRDDRRWVEDGPFLTSAGVTAAIDASLQLVVRAAGESVAARTAAALHLPPPGDAASAPTRFTARDALSAFLDAAFRWPKRRVVVPLADGVDELPLAALLDAWPRTLAASTASVSPGRRAVRSRYGLVLVPLLDAADARAGEHVVAPVAGGAPPFDATLLAIASELGGAPATLAARLLELPAGHLGLEAHPTPRAAQLASLAALLAAGALAGIVVRRGWARRRARSGRAATGSSSPGHDAAHAGPGRAPHA